MAAERSERNQAVNIGEWAREIVASQDCQDRVDVKAFTGKGKHAKLRQLVDNLEAAETEMHALSALSKDVAGLPAYLVVHQRKVTGYVFLRWRQRLGKNRHLSWDEAQELVRPLRPELQEWCRKASQQAQLLNERHLSCRKALEVTRMEIEVAPAKPVYARSILARAS